MKQLLNVSGELSHHSEKTHITYLFEVKNLRNLKFQFDYDPKTITDEVQCKQIIESCLKSYTALNQHEIEEVWSSYYPVKNLLTIGIDDPEKFRGAAHRQPKQEVHDLSEHHASAGMLAGPIIDGMWSVTISVHALQSQSCQYTLKVWSEVEHD